MAPVCDSVLGLDISGDAVAAAMRNAELNNANNVEFREANVFDALRELDAAGERFDTIVLDPPAFAKNRASIKSAARGYKEINLRAIKLLNPGGLLITARARITCLKRCSSLFSLTRRMMRAADCCWWRKECRHAITRCYWQYRKLII